MTIKQLYDRYRQGSTTASFFLGTVPSEETGNPCIDFYYQNYTNLDRWLVNIFGYRSVDDSVVDWLDFTQMFYNSVLVNTNNINQLFKALESEYNPLENYDRTETTNNFDSFGKVKTHTGNDKATTTNGNTTNDSSTFYDTTKTVTDTVGRDDYIDHHHDRHKFDSHIHGNIGVTTNANMGLQEISLRSTYNTYVTIWDMLLSSFTYFSDGGVDLL